MVTNNADAFCLDQANCGKSNVTVSVSTSVTDYRYIWIKTTKEIYDKPDIICPAGPFLLGQQMHNDPPLIGAAGAVGVRVTAIELGEAMGGSNANLRMVGYRMSFGHTYQNAIEWKDTAVGKDWLSDAESYQLFAVRTDY